MRFEGIAPIEAPMAPRSDFWIASSAEKLLRLRDEGLHPVLSKLRLKGHNILGGPCVADLAGEREN